MGATLRTLIVGAALLSVAACGAEKAAQDPPSTSAPTHSSSAPAAPVMPALAREHTEAGAEAFIKHFWDVVNFSQKTLDTAPLKALMNPSCTGCARGVVAIEKIAARRGAASGGDVTATVVSSERQFTDTSRLMSMSLRLRIAPMTITYPSPRPAENYARSIDRERFLISEQPSGWRVELIEPIK